MFIDCNNCYIFSENALRAIATYLNLVPPEGKENEAPWHRLDKPFLKELLVRKEKYYKIFIRSLR